MTLIIECNRTRTLLWLGHGCYSDRMLLEHKRYYGLGMEATATVCSWNTNDITAMDGNVTVCSWNTNAIMIRAWMLSSSSALKHDRMLLEHERYYGLGMGATVTVCSWNTNVLMVWAWALWSPCALGTRTFSWFGHGCSGQRMLLEHERYYGLGMDATVTVCSWNIMVWAWMLQ